MELQRNAKGYEPLLTNLAGHYAKNFSRLEMRHQGMLVDAGVTSEEWDRAGVAGRRNIVAQRDYLNDPKHEAVIYFKLEVFDDVLTEKIAEARTRNASDAVVALREVKDWLEETLETDRAREGELIRSLRAEIRQQREKSNAPVDRGYISDELTALNLAAEKFWKNANPDDRGTHRSNREVERWLIEERGFSQSLAAKGATIIRPDWASTGRPPER
ncbi:hypothetical protein [Paraburkholderia sp. J8-2]|uniref:hypothetical protein n=1 Tax=Paraburkholderia sp. J8-2 TaxID=2805440 RepID=UPI002AB5F9FF|nr:hypothetical protein [Paraburkholderia sp. J8-2]